MPRFYPQNLKHLQQYHRAQLTAGHSDDLAMSGKMDEAWGWLADRGFDIIQTDWLLPVRMYFQKRGLKVR